MHILEPHEVPVAYSMVDLVRSPTDIQDHPYQRFMCFWTAFNNVYVANAEMRGGCAQKLL